MATDSPQFKDNEADEHVLELLKRVISTAYGQVENNEVGRALLMFLVRVANSWRSIRTLRNYTPDEEGFTVDAGTLLRAMFDGYIQAAYIVHDAKEASQRAKDYLDFEIVERFKLANAVLKHDTTLSRHLKASPKRADGEKRLEEDFERVKSRYFIERKRSDGTIKRGPGIRNTWYAQNLYNIAEQLGKGAEYDSLLRMLHLCVHSSPFAVGRGPMVSGEHVVHWAATIAARVAKLSVEHHEMELDDFYGPILEALARPCL